MGINEVGAGYNRPVANSANLNFKGAEDKIDAKKSEKHDNKKLWLALGSLAALGAAGVLVYKNRNTKAVQDVKTKADDAVQKIKTKVDDAVSGAKTKTEQTAEKVETKVETKLTHGFNKESLPTGRITPEHIDNLTYTAAKAETMQKEAKEMLESGQKIADEVLAYKDGFQGVSCYSVKDLGIIERDANDNVIRRLVKSPDGKGTVMEVLDGNKVIKRISQSGNGSDYIVDDFASNLSVSIFKNQNNGSCSLSTVRNLSDETNYVWKMDNSFGEYFKGDAKLLKHSSENKKVCYEFTDKCNTMNLDENSVVQSFVRKNSDNEIATCDMKFENGSLVRYKAGENIDDPQSTNAFIRFVDNVWKELKFADGKWS